ncbi:Peptidase, M23/M37 family [hydrothermal vent metagenome]|uniref:Peptidase, M23/M37 family n=1 Tax=hydrothermal vent metagenome TaxID=652676 RepID=A0A3B0VE62_9ZZZZ
MNSAGSVRKRGGSFFAGAGATGTGKRGNSRRPSKRGLALRYLAVAALFIFSLGIFFITSRDAVSSKKEEPLILADAVDSPGAAASVSAESGLQAPSPSPSLSTVEFKVKGNDSFYTILDGLDVPPEQIVRMARIAGGVYNLGKVKVGDRLSVTRLGNEIERIEYRFSDIEGMRLERDSDASGGYSAELFEIPYVIEQRLVHGVIDSSLYEAGRRAGASPGIIMELSDIFAWDVDFSTDIRKGDTFSVLYEIATVDGRAIDAGKVLAAEVVNNGKKHAAIFFNESGGGSGYYNLQGKSLRRTLLRSPLRYRRISSYFSKRRYHPIKKRYRPHHGIDYAAPTGTPIETSGDGRVTFAGWKRGYGNYIVVKHNSIYTTAYGHLSRIKKGIRKGRKVKQGQVIGYVGSTGLSTGPHLHYEVKQRGRHVNPLALKSAPRRSLNKAELQTFSALRRDLMALLSRSDTLLAMNEKGKRKKGI